MPALQGCQYGSKWDREAPQIRWLWLPYHRTNKTKRASRPYNQGTRCASLPIKDATGAAWLYRAFRYIVYATIPAGQEIQRWSCKANVSRPERSLGLWYLLMNRFIDCEKWRKDFGVDNLVQNFEYKEKPKVFEYYPQYYHKTDKVSLVWGGPDLILWAQSLPAG